MENKKFAWFWIRHIALTIDIIILTILSWFLFYFINYFWFDSRYESSVWIIIWLFIDLIWFVFFAYFHFSFWKTPWKMAVWVKVVSQDWEKLTLLQSFWRSFATILSTIPLWLWYAWAWWDEKKRTFHDMLAKTYVIEDNSISKGWVIFWNIMICILFILLFILVILWIFLLSNPDFLIELERGLKKWI